MSYFNTRSKRKYRGRAPYLVFGVLGLFVVGWVLRAILIPNRDELPLLGTSTLSHSVWSKRALVAKVTELETTIAALRTEQIVSDLLRDENTKLKAELGRTPHATGVLAHVRTIPNRSFYDTIVIDAGADRGISVGQVAYAFDSVALGTIADVTSQSATLLLYSQSGRETAGTVVGSDTAVTLIGRGNGEYEVRMPRDVRFDVGGLVAYQSVDSALLAQIERIVTDPRDPFQRLLARAPVNLQALKWVIVR